MANTENRLSALPQEKKQIEKLELDALHDANEATLQKMLDDIGRVLLDNPSKTEVLYAEKFFKNAEILSSRYLSGVYKGQEDTRENWQNLSDEYESYKAGRTLSKSLNGKLDTYNSQFTKRPIVGTKPKKDIDPLKGIIKNNEDPESLNSGSLGREDAFSHDGRGHASIEGRFSSTSGFSGEGVASHMIGEKTSGAIDIEIGAEQLRTSVTLARQLAEGHMGKITVERFQEVGKYMFDSGMVEERTSQHSFGAAYQFKINKKWLEFVEARGYITKAQGQALASKDIVIDTPTLFEIYRNDRNIAGGTKTGGDITLGFKTSDTTRIMITGGKEDVKFDNIYSGDEGNRSGFNGKIALEWLLGNRTTITPSIGTSSTEKLNKGVRVTHRLDNDMSVHLDIRETEYQDNIGGTEKRNMAVAGGVSTRFATPGDRRKIEESAEIYAASMEERRNNPAKARKFMPALDMRREDIDEAIDAEINKKGSNNKQSPYQEQLLWTEKAAVRESRTITRPDQRTIRDMNINKTLLPAGVRVLENTGGDIEIPLEVNSIGPASITRNGEVFSDSGVFQLSESRLIINTALLREPTAGVIDTYVVTINEVGGGQTVVTLQIEKGSVKIRSLNVTRIPAPNQLPPTMGDVPNQAGVSGTAFNLAVAPYVTLTNGDAITTYTLTGALPTGVTFNTTTGVLSGTPTQTGTFPLSITATDNDGASNSDAFNLVIAAAPSNNPPVPTFAALTMNEDTVYNGTLTATDAEGNPLTYAKVADPSHGAVTVNADGTFTYTPTANYFGADSFTYSVSDGTNPAVNQVVSITVNDVAEANAAPEAVSATYPIDIGNTSKTFSWSALLTATDPDGDTLTATVQVQGTKGTFAIVGDNVTYTPNANQTGSDIATIRISDGQGHTIDRTITVNGIDKILPVITNLPNFGGGVASSSTTLGWTVDMTDNGAFPGSTISITADQGASITGFDNSSYGTKSFNLIAPVGNPAGSGPKTIHITYTITDAAGNVKTEIQNVNVAEAPNNNPVASDVTRDANFNASETYDLAPDISDIETPDAGLTIVVDSGPAHASILGGSFVWETNTRFKLTADGGYNGPDSFTYHVEDGMGGVSPTKTVTINNLAG